MRSYCKNKYARYHHCWRREAKLKIKMKKCNNNRFLYTFPNKRRKKKIYNGFISHELTVETHFERTELGFFFCIYLPLRRVK